MKYVTWVMLAFGFLVSAWASAEPEELTAQMEDPAGLRKIYDVHSNYLDPKLEKKRVVRVAILDKGFGGISDKTYYLPKHVTLVEKYGEAKTMALDATDSGRRLAQIVWAMAGYPEEWLRMNLYNANGLANFELAVKAAVDWKADIILSTQNFESFGDFDGSGGVNQLVSSVSRKKLIWIQSAGEYRTKTYNGKVIIGTDATNKQKWVKFRDGKNWFLKVKSHSDEQPVTVTLSWNAFSPGKEFEGTDKDLDIVMWEPDAFGEPRKIVGKSTLRQVTKKDPGENETNLATERFEVTLEKRQHPYYLAVKYVGGKFSAADDTLRVTVVGKKKPFYDYESKKEVDPLEFVDATDDGSIMVPADNRYVVTVGTFGKLSSVGKVLETEKPEVKLDKAEVLFSDKVGMAGPAAASALFAAMTALMKAREPDLQRKHLVSFSDVKNGWQMPSPSRLREAVGGH